MKAKEPQSIHTAVQQTCQQPPSTGQTVAHRQVDIHARSGSAQSRVSGTPGSPQTPRHPSESQRIGPYVLGKTLGVGSTGRVKLGLHIETNQRVAIKIISKEILDPNEKCVKKDDMNRKLEREITIMKLIRHPNVLQLLDVYETSKELFLVLEHVEGGELFDYLVKKGRLNDAEAVSFFQQIIMGVEYCHQHLICHRDLKPENLLLDKNRNVKVADFGMANMQVPSKMLETSCGSPHYASPEIIKGIRYDGAASDIWSCGIILYALITGNLPFDDENIRRLLNKVKTGLFFIPDHVGPEARDLIKRMLVVDPAKRISMKDVIQHPWFQSRPIKNDSHYPSPLETASLSEPLGPNLEMDIIESLSLLGWTNREELYSALREKETNTQKVYYNLLRARKWEIFEHYDAEKHAMYDVEGGPRRRTESYSSAQSIDSKHHNEVSEFKEEKRIATKQAEIPIDVGTDEAKSSSPIIPAIGSPGTTRRAVSEMSTRQSRIITANVRINSPLAMAIMPQCDTGTNDNQKEKHYTYNQDSSESVKSVDTDQAIAGRRRAQSSATAIATLKKNSLTISIPRSKDVSDTVAGASTASVASPSTTEGPRSAALVNAFAAIGLGTPKFHRKVFDAPQTPVISQTPKQSWFTHLFNFKPESFSFDSSLSRDETSNVLMTLLHSLDVKFQIRKDGLIKCKYDPNTILSTPSGAATTTSADKEDDSILQQSTGAASVKSIWIDAPTSPAISGKAVKFKIEILVETGDAERSNLLRVHMTQQQGAFSTFQYIAEVIQARWADTR
ncbi:hypothetical protein BDV3_001477 [Batrachochytrium dendrobatidis]|uniref:Protein kinase domain-containing protein n=2 Tax=Batrachochytrium dendrobatidis (strain JEL423) TaxID=403673 RepID=A0A177W9Y4_BATDL|nr:serine/threonine-protein kinase gin4 [Batrachochytrium dendrobatidis]OAJ36908.1 hypothetical protein, variant 1 [Batrachochytrium dendrobatidis JEL423]